MIFFVRTFLKEGSDTSKNFHRVYRTNEKGMIVPLSFIGGIGGNIFEQFQRSCRKGCHTFSARRQDHRDPDSSTDVVLRWKIKRVLSPQETFLDFYKGSA